MVVDDYGDILLDLVWRSLRYRGIILKVCDDVLFAFAFPFYNLPSCLDRFLHDMDYENPDLLRP